MKGLREFIEVFRRRKAARKLEKIVFNALAELGISGFRKLALNEFRISNTPYCSHELFYMKVFPEISEPPVGEVQIIRNQFTGTITVPMGAANSGTMTHQGVQVLIIDDASIISVEEEVEYEIEDILLSGHVDITYLDKDNEFMICDIKTLSSNVFKSICEGVPKAGSYAEHKLIMSIIQANSYAVTMNVDKFSIMWMDRNDQRFNIDVFDTSRTVFDEVIDKLKDIMLAVNEFQMGNEDIRPKLCGIANCRYCAYYREKCLGWDRVKENE